jgi:hypothetical protein
MAFATADLAITAWFLGGLALSFVVLSGLARLMMRSRAPAAAANAVRAYALSSLYRPGSATPSAVLARARADPVRNAGAGRPLDQQRIALEPAGERLSFYFLDVPNSDRDRFITLLRDGSAAPHRRCADAARPDHHR